MTELGSAWDFCMFIAGNMIDFVVPSRSIPSHGYASNMVNVDGDYKVTTSMEASHCQRMFMAPPTAGGGRTFFAFLEIKFRTKYENLRVLLTVTNSESGSDSSVGGLSTKHSGSKNCGGQFSSFPTLSGLPWEPCPY